MGIFDLPTGANPAKDTPVGKDEMGRTIYQTGYGARYVMPDAPKTEARFPTNFAYEMTTPQERAAIAANPPAPQPEPNILSGTGIMGTLGNFNQMLNPVEAIGQSMSASQQMLAPETAGWDRVTALGNMLSGVAGVTAPAAAAYKAAMPAATALMESLLGWSPLRQPILDRATQPGPMPTLYSNPIAGDVGRPPVTFADAERAMQEAQGIRAYQGSPYNFAAERLVRMPDGSTQYIVGAPDVLPNVPAGAEVLQNFPLGRMRMDKIGTGEGAQAYGMGLYTAENEGIARSYRDQLSRPYLATPDGQNIAEKYGPDVADIFENSAGDPKDLQDTLLRIRKIVKQNLDDIGVSDVSELKSEFNGDLPSTIIEFSNRADRLENLMNSGDVKLVNEGKIYQVSINAKPEDFINYDAPLSAQGQKVKEQFGYTPKPTPDEEIAAYELAKREAPNNIGEHPAVQDIYRRESAANAAERLFQSKVQGGGVDEAARIGLSQAGIPGIKYLDAGSRSFIPTTIKETPSGSELYWGNDPKPVDTFPTRQAAEDAAKQFDTRTRNFVVFDDKLISIVKKYGIAGAAVMLGTSADQISQTLTENMTQEELNNLVSGA
jgi:hypothetical protein